MFKNRVKLDFSMVNSKLTLDGIANRVIDVFNSDRSKNILIEFIFKKTAREFFEILKDKMNEEVVIVEISGDDNKFERKKIIKLIKERKVNIVVATQVIEAGVDIDMDIGFKDISVIDSEEQFIGRINRSCGNEGCAYFFNYDNEKVVYRDDVRTDYSIKAEKEQKILASKRFIEYFDEILKSLYMVACGGDFNKNYAGSKCFIMKATQKPVHIFLRIPILVALARITEIAVVAQFFQILVFDVKFLHQSLIVIQAVSGRRVLRRLLFLPFHYAENLFQQFSFA